MAGELVLVIDDSPTIVKVVQLVLTKAGFEVATAGDGELGLAAARTRRPDLILLDFVMPKMNGYQFCREMSADAELREIPVVLMSAKGDQVGERFVKVMGIVDYITKPFSPEAITAVVQHTIAKYGGKSDLADSHDSGELGPDDLPETGGNRRAAREAMLRSVRGQIADVVAARVAALFGLADAARDDDDSRVPTDAGAIADAARSALDDATLLGILSRWDPEIAGGGAATSMHGDLRVIPLAEVLQLLDVQEQSGVLTLQRGPSVVEIYFRRGRIDQAVGDGVPEDLLFGRFVIDAELMQRGDFESFLASRAPQSDGGRDGLLIGSQLVKLGYLGEADLRQCLTRQSSELVYEILRWRNGTFRFAAGRELPALAIEAALELDVEAILMEGFRRVDEWHLIERAIDDFDLVFLRNEDAVAQMGRGRLTREELAILELVNGKNSVKDIIRKSRMGSFEVSKMVYRLLSIKLIRRRVLPVAV
ncbi:MAG: response regulator [Kofleriaceae bacterium]|nr:response regulator [Myxococcales bacterium]MCB9572377.1 response regulator [Kofleriaceae bacterium]